MNKPPVLAVVNALVVASITIWALAGIVRAPMTAQQTRTDRDRVLENSLDINALKDADRRAEAYQVIQDAEIKELKRQIREMEIQVAQAKAGGYTLISAFGIALTILSIGQYVRLTRK